MSDGFDDSAIGAEDAFQQVLAVARDSESKNFSVADGLTQLAEQTSGILDGIAFAQRITGEEQFLIWREAHGLGRGRAKIAAHHDSIELFLLHRGLRFF